MQNLLGKGPRDSSNRTPVRPIRIPGELWTTIKTEAKKNSTSASAWVRGAIVEKLKKVRAKAF